MQPTKEETSQLLKYVLPDDYSEKDREKYPISAQEVVEALKAGKTVEIRNAVIEGDFNLESVVVEGKVTIEGTMFKGLVDCSYATFKQVLRLNGSTFEGDANFSAATAEKDIFLNNATFKAANFVDLSVTGVFYCESTTFKKGAIFARTTIKKDIFLEKSIFEDGEASFLKTLIGGAAEFTCAVFKQKANFNSAQIEELAAFNQATFEGDADFISAQIGGNAEFDGAVFKQKANFNSAQIEGHAFFRPATFEGDADFGSAQIGGNAGFTNAHFKEYANFYTAQFKMDAIFEGTVFDKNVIFQNISFRTCFFDRDPAKQFLGTIDLRGCTYERIEPTSIWEELMNRLYPYDRQPFTQLEETFRRAGQDRLANEVYYARKEKETALYKERKERLIWIGRLVHKWLVGYGVHIWRILIASVIAVIIGTAVFQIDRAIELKQETQQLTAEEGSSNTNQDRGVPHGWCDGFWLSVRFFLPMEIPFGSKWIASSNTFCGIKFSTIAIILKIAGWVLVPVGVAGLTGILKR
ncbi:MAG TPA: pentapeptide repeat-containing protein [Candidatus Brocadiia bacterium]|nr:pentapeptide repeat-containing protein [Candidatus Brocadiales bacterium]